MLYVLDRPSVLLGIIIAVVVGLLVHDLAVTGAAVLLGDRTPRRRGWPLGRPAAHIEPFGAVAAIIVGYGWGAPVPLDERWRARRGRLALTFLVGPLAWFALALLLFTADRGAGGSGATILGSAGEYACAGAVVACLPVPPLDGGRLVLALAPPSLFWQQARHQLQERNIGLAIALAVVLLPRLIPSLPQVVPQLAGRLITLALHITGAS